MRICIAIGRKRSCSVGLFRFLRHYSFEMANRDAGKKAAAVRAIDDYVKVEFFCIKDYLRAHFIGMIANVIVFAE